MNKFNMNQISNSKNILILGQDQDLKSNLVLDYLYYHGDEFPMGTVVSPIDVYQSHVPSSLIHIDYTSELMTHCRRRQENLRDPKYADMNPYAFLILDTSVKDLNDQPVKWLIQNNYHYGLSLIITFPSYIKIPPHLRGAFDYIVIFAEPKLSNQQRLYEHYAGMFPSFESFRMILNKVTQNHGCLVIDNSSNSDKMEDQVFWYRTDIDKPDWQTFRVCLPSLWETNNGNGQPFVGTYLYSGNNHFGYKYSQYLVKTLQHNPSLTILELDSIHIGIDGIRIICEALKHRDFTSITTIRLIGKQFGVECYRAVGEALQHNTTVNTLELRAKLEDVQVLFEVLKHGALALRSLDLCDNQIGDEGVRTLFESLQLRADALISIDLSCNQIGDQGARAMAEAFQHRPSILRSLNLCGNQIGDQGVRALFESLQIRADALISLDLSCNQIGDQGARAMAEAFQHRPSVLRSLNLSGNQIGDEGVRALAKALQHMESTLISLDLSHNQIGDDGCLVKALQYNTTLTYLKLIFNQIGVEGGRTIMYNREKLIKENEEKIKTIRNLLEHTYLDQYLIQQIIALVRIKSIMVN